MREPPYTRDILRLAAAIPYQQDFASMEDGVERRSRTCGSRVRVAIRLDDQGRVVNLVQAVEACAYGQAAAALMGARAIGRDLAEAESDRDSLKRWLKDGAVPEGWPELAALEPALQRTSRHGAILLPFEALAAAIAEAAA
ncbi:iron-sulfur cluster assembly scaffold protein [Sphingomonas sp. HDW15A]|nr:iron-sulfur cluster assembly scaffold protein [Sphingomonas sp. HDW15A]